ncbi:hypothetical protein ACFSHT_01320 [Paraburkholderia silviterrae]|uniref:Uncharacterized protein n=1 Tax=Paraburkholderia silviterrae TaxID=2528715 RepID=A0A4R5MG06_9BURK|nr:hypothetical protein [Paraburkholderia silviterrae]TDG26241.1 hypothetical protein EYW47_02520 [Paraburkholderia silviterrae]
MTYSPVSEIIGIPATGIFVGIVLSWFVRRLQRSVARYEAQEARSRRASPTPNVVYAQPTSLPVDAATRIAMAMKTKNIALRLDGGRYAHAPLASGHVPVS